MIKTLAAVLVETGRQRPYRTSRPLVVEEVSLEEPRHGEVLIRVAAAGVCHSDLSVIDGSRPRPLPMILGHEASGVIEEVGPGATDLQAGDPVVFSFVPMCRQCEFCATGRPALCLRGAEANQAGTLMNGARRFSLQGRPVHHHLGVSGFSQYTVAVRESVIKIDAAFPLREAALFGCAILTGVGAVVNTARIPAGASAAIFGLGGVGLASVMGAVSVGANPVMAVDVSQAKLELAARLGATHLINAAETDPVDAVLELTDGGAAFTLEAVGSATVLGQAIAAGKRGGTTVTVGLPGPQDMLAVSALRLTAEERTLKGSFMGSCVPHRDIPRFMGLYQRGQLPAKELVTGDVALSEINSAFDNLAAGEAVRQLVIPS